MLMVRRLARDLGGIVVVGAMPVGQLLATIEILEAVADYLGVDLLLSSNDAIGRDFNPRNWAVTRANCEVLAGGVVDSTLTRSFLDTGPPYAQTGWAILAPTPLDDIDGRTLGALTLVSGLDRIGLATYLRRHGVTARVVRSSTEFVDGIADGQFAGGVTELLLAGGLAADKGWWVAPCPTSSPATIWFSASGRATSR